MAGKGRLEVGSDADIALWNPSTEYIYRANDLHDNVGYNPFAGARVKGWPETVLSRGAVVVDQGQLHARPGRGRRVVMQRSAAMLG